MNAINLSILIFLGGGLGSLSRFGLTKFGHYLFDTKFPIGDANSEYFGLYNTWPDHFFCSKIK